MNLTLNGREFTEGDQFLLTCRIDNEAVTDLECDAYILLGFSGLYWCWPSWCPIEQELDYLPLTISTGSGYDEDVLDFIWPVGAGAANGLEFYGAIFEVDTFVLIGEVQCIQWRYY